MTKRQKQTRNNQVEMGLFDHLNELRQRLVKAIIALIIGVIVGMFVAEPALQMLIAPLGDHKPVALKPTESPSVFFKIAVVIGVIIAMPVIVYQLFQFARPGLEPHERRYAMIGAPVASLFFAAGVIFAATVILPAAVPFLQGFLSDFVEPQYSIDFYMSFVSNVLLWAGLVFETPLVMYFLAKLGVVTSEDFVKAWRIVVVGAAVGAAIITPTVDPINMLLIMGPFMLLYGLGILLARLA